MTDVQPQPPNLPVDDERRAPILFFDDAPLLAHGNGIIAISLSVSLQVGFSDGVITNRRSIVAHLRSNVVAAKALRNALDQAILMAEPISPEGKAN